MGNCGHYYMNMYNMKTICLTCFGLPDTPNKPTRTFYPKSREEFFREEYCDIGPDKRAQLELEVENLNRRSEGILATSRGHPSYYEQWELQGPNIAEHLEYLLDKVLLPHFWLKTNEGSQPLVQTRALIALLSHVLTFTQADLRIIRTMNDDNSLMLSLGIGLLNQFMMPLNTYVEGKCDICERNLGLSPAKISCGHIFDKHCLEEAFDKMNRDDGRLSCPMECGTELQSFVPDMKRGTPIPKWLLKIMGPPPSV
jgi:hypothetical protein